LHVSLEVILLKYLKI